MEGHICDQFNTQLRVHCKPMKGHFCDQSNTKIRLYCIPMKGHICDQCNTKVRLYCQPMKFHTCNQCKTESTAQPIIGISHQNLHGYINGTGIVVNSATLRASYAVNPGKSIFVTNATPRLGCTLNQCKSFICDQCIAQVRL